MKYLLFCLILFVINFSSQAQNHLRNFRIKVFGADSIAMPLNDEYYLIEDSCVQITRYVHYNSNAHKFYGRVRDVSKLNPELVVSEYNYTPGGLKDGPFIAHYLNGNLRAKGSFKNDNYDGKWEMYFEDSKPELMFEVSNGEYHITDEWNASGTKVIDNGNGNYIADLGQLYWTGKLANGKPDGTWKLINKDDITKTPIAKEYFKKGQFHDGAGGADLSYTDASRIILVDPQKLPFVNAEKMLASPVPCNGKGIKHIVYAQYIYGMESFSDAIARAIGTDINRIASKVTVSTVIAFEGAISTKGAIINLKCNDADISVPEMISKLKNLPLLHPATADGIPVEQKFTITFTVYERSYQFIYNFLPIKE